MDQADHTIVQDPQAQQLAQELSLQAQPELAEGAPDLPGYVLQRRLGRGSFGEVWAATQSGSGQAVAIKIFTQPKGLDFRYLQHEIKRLRQVAEHPHIVTLLDADFHHEPPFFSMGLYQQSLAAWRQESKETDLEQVVGWLDQIAQALKFTHDKGLLHCDLKPANVLLDAEQRVKVADFGQAVERGLPGSAVGSLGYMAPEQASLEQTSPDVRWDIYGLGATAYYLLTGRPPRLSDQNRETMGSITDPTERLHRYRQVIASTPLVPLRELCPKVDADLDRLITSCLSLDPDGRPQHVTLVLEDLDRRRKGMPLLCARPWSAWYRTRRFARRNALSLALVGVIAASAAAGANEYLQRAEAQRHAMALQQFDMGWQIAKEGRTAEAALWWAKSLETDEDILPARAALDSVSLKLVGELTHGDSAVTTVGNSPDGKWLASADAGGLLKLWQENKVVATIEGLNPAPSDAYILAPAQFAFTSDGGHILTTNGLYVLGQKKPLVPFDGEVAIDPEGRGALLTSGERARLFSSESQEMTEIKSPRPAAAVAFGSGQGNFAVLGTDGKVDLYCNGKPIATGIHEKVGALAYSPDGEVVVTCSEDRTAKIWGAHNGKEQKSLDHGWRVTSARFTADGRHLITTCYNGEVRLWDVSSGLAVMHSPMRHSWFAYGTVGHTKEDLFASYGVDGRARVWRANGMPYSPWYEHGGAIRDVAFDESQKRLVTAGQDGKLRVWDLGEERKGIGTVDLGPEQEIGSISLDPKGQLFAAAWQNFPDGGGAVLASRDGKQEWRLGPDGVLASKVLFSDDGEQIAVAAADGKVRLFDRQGQALREVSHPASVVSIDFSPDDGKTLLSGSVDGTVQLSGATSRTFTLGSQLNDARLTADGRLVGAAGNDGKAVVWDAQSGQEITSYQHDAPLRRVVFDNQAAMALLCGQDGVARLLDLKSKTEKTFKHDLMVTNGAFDSTGERVVTTSLDGAVKIWDTRTGAQLPSPGGHEGPVLLAQFSPDDSLILSVSKDGTAQIWESATGLPFGLPVRHQRIAYDGCFSADGTLIVTGGHDGAVKFTGVPLQAGAVIPSTSELEATIGSRLAQKDGTTVCESVARQQTSTNGKPAKKS